MHIFTDTRVITRLHHGIILVLLVFLSGCTFRPSLPPPSAPAPVITPPSLPAPPPPSPSVPSAPSGTYSPELGPAASLYNQAETSFRQGRYRQAELELERALRIEPRNAHYWHTMARIKYSQNLHKQAIQFCLKSKSLAGRNKRLIRLNDALISKARKDQAN